MNKILGTAMLAGLSVAGGAKAQEFKGAEVAVEVLSYEEDDDITSTSYRGSVEAGVYGGLGVAADLSFQDFGDDEGVRSFTLHALYDAFQFATVGAFASRDSSDGSDSQIYGIEAGRSFGSLGVESFLGAGDSEGVDFGVFGIEALYDISPAFSVTGSVTSVALDGGTIGRASLGGEYRFNDTGPAVYGEIGRLSVEDDAETFGVSTTYFGLGARIAIGPNRGTTFDSRGLRELLSGF
jgi:hypothetical protein